MDDGPKDCQTAVGDHQTKWDEDKAEVWDRPTPLHIACHSGFYQCAKVLVDAGADLEDEDKLDR